MPHPGWSAFAFEGIGTQWDISTPAALSADVRDQVLHVVGDYDATWSRFRSDSAVSALSGQPGSITLPPHARELERLYSALYRLSGGGMTPLIGSSLEVLGYDARYSLVPAGPPQAPPRWEDVLDWDGTALTAHEPVVVDVGAAGKGQLVDLVASVLRGSGYSDYLVDASGDMVHAGSHPVTVALEHPYNARQAIGLVVLDNAALCASAANRRAWGDGWHHVLDGTTGSPVRTTVASWTMASNAMTADALATAMFLMEPEVLQREFQFSWLAVDSGGSATFSAGFEGRLFS
ncbi:FAD:protein FMN transferase [Paenarthrobacter ilicis]|uniref:FAD:protein FMN transferase n=1 Tax=Paenarthrobacter ilicis TaxID=43665 RepID=A0ABX0TBK7_9MICC|nr:thiamine biosynthesis lipoprotein [Paenarthrobacter ilicis]NII99876.1 thiamine biosynthesis lipoprotein [Paenarthrobacter ilicis]